MWEVDLHGKKLVEAFTEIETVINAVRLSRKTEHLRLITGKGKIKEELYAFLKDFDVECVEELSNGGSFLVSIE